MGWDTMSAEQFDITIVKHVSGKCPMCETGFDFTFTPDTEGGDYNCPCGYFSYYGHGDRVSVDNHNIPQEEWVARLKASRLDVVEVGNSGEA